MLGRIDYKIGECNIADTIFTVKYFDDEEVQLFGNDATYFITKDECWVVKGDVETEIDKVKYYIVNIKKEYQEVGFVKGVRNDFF